MDENANEEIKTTDDTSVERAKNAKAVTKRLIRILGKQKLKFLAILISVLISSSLIIAEPLVIGKAIDKLYNGIKASIATGVKFHVNISTMGEITGLLLLIYIATSLFKYFEQYMMAGVSQTLTLGLRKELSDKLNRLPLKYYDSHKKGDILSRATNDLERVADSLQEGLMQLITSVVTMTLAVIAMVTISPMLTLIIAVTLMVSMLATTKFANKIEGYFANNQETLGELNGFIEETFTGQLVIKAFSKEEDALQDFKEVNQRIYDASRKAEFYAYAIEPFIRFLGKIGYVIVAVIGGVFAVNGTLTLGNIQAFLQYVDQCSEPMTQISYILNMLQSAVASAERVFEILDEEEEAPEELVCKNIDNPRGEVAFEHVKFGYSDNAILMNDINLNLSAGSTIAIVGPTGAGKTTLVNLLMRFYEIQGGRITIDGVDIKEMSRSSLRTMFGMVLQDTWIFHGSIQENIAYSRMDASLDDVILAAKAAHADHFIRTLPEGYKTILEADGSNVSQGQKQLLTIARAILADPTILILDEATSSVDTRTEAEIQKAMSNLMKGRTSFVIAHRLSTIRDADLILVMQNGTIIEQGKHQELLNKKGFYEKLYNSQFANSAAEEVKAL
ncbi:putative ABC transporter ATP-binding protein [Clostridium liquoris]|jgi:ATP-binding cassette subfamily B protein|uniref:Putative ABC transporter ATP-binding protein n=1 Tax=Clostridium liquoris TaxID=1289519 RepID=A0A2T0B1B6_9CLOT|nr:ABC transporter ATP-binding protein [Clostridium liquoris]PRR77407.1 putative ABC transporter ATP-binding protein [Clostridium liquoris]